MQVIENKKPLNMRTLMMAVAMTACVVSHAFAATPKAGSTITHDQITLGDVFDGVTENADYALAPAPANGQSVILNTQDLTRISEAFHLGWKPEGGVQQVVIRRASSEIDSYDIQAALQKELAEQTQGRKYEMELSDRSVGFHVPAQANKSVAVERLTFDIVKGDFKALVAAAGEKKEVSGRLYQITELPVLRDPLRQGDVISRGDIDMIDVRASAVSANMIVDADKLIGQTPRRGIAAMKPIMAGDVQAPLVIKKGDLVTMVLKSPVISLTAQGRAIENGAEGDVVHVMNTSSKQVLEAIVTGPRTVSIKAPSSILSMNTF